MKYDVIFIGGGHTTIHGANILNAAGKKVLIIEKNRMGGTCTTYGCDPKILLDAPFEIIEQSNRYEAKGLDGNLQINWNQLMNYKNEIISPLSGNAENMFKSTGIDIIKEKAIFIDNHTVEAGGNRYTAENIVISTGQRPAKLDIIGKEYLHDSNDLLFEENFPKRITFIGAGIISLEFASMAVKLGSEVNIIEFSDRALRQYHNDYVNKIVEKLKKEGANFYFNESVTEIIKSNNEFTVKTLNGIEVITDYVLDATGRISNIEGFGLETLGINTDKGGIVVDNHLRTNISNIYASGDVVSKNIAKLTPTAAFESKYIASHILGNEKEIEYPAVPSLVFTIPRIAQVGVTQEEAKNNPDKYHTATFKYGEMMLFQQKNEIAAELSVVLDENNYLVGADIYGDEAADLINIFTIIINQKMRRSEIEKMIFAFPATTWGIFNFFLNNVLVD